MGLKELLLHVNFTTSKEHYSPTSASVEITVNGGLPEWGVTHVVDIMECPSGFHKNEQSLTM